MLYNNNNNKTLQQQQQAKTMASASIAALTAPTSEVDSISGGIQPQQTQKQPWHPSLPRSVVWRLRLGLLQAPPSAAADASNTNKPALEAVLQNNLTLLQEEQAQYQRLQEAYRDHFTADKHGGEGKHPGNDSTDAAATTESSPDPSSLSSPQDAAAAAAIADPLTAMLQQQEAQEHRRHDLELKYRKEKALQKRGLASHTSGGAYQPTEDPNDTGTTTTTSYNNKKVDHETVRNSRLVSGRLGSFFLWLCVP